MNHTFFPTPLSRRALSARSAPPLSCPRCTPSARRRPCPLPAACRLLAAALVLPPLRAVCSPPPFSCPRCAPSARRRPCPLPATRRLLAAALVLSPLRAVCSPPPLSCPRCAPSARLRPCPVLAARCLLATALSWLLPGARLTLCRYSPCAACDCLRDCPM